VIPESLLEHVAEMFRLMGDSTRLAILRCLMAGEQSVGQIVADTGLGQANVSKHLRMLADAGLVGRRKSGLQVFYAISDPLVNQLCQTVCSNLAIRLRGEIERNQELIGKLQSIGLETQLPRGTARELEGEPRQTGTGRSQRAT
jgi:DNA-binding transcriptional ArsR family regulator